MIVQSAGAGTQRHFVMTMDQHTALASQFAAHFGNERFEAVDPLDLMLHVVRYHDAGWQELDAEALRDPATGLPYNLVQTPFGHIVATSSKSPDFNGRQHPYCELISSMHSWGLYNGRYGMSDKVLLNGLAADNRAMADVMLDAEIARQDQLKAALSKDPNGARWIEPTHLLQNYKQLQFFDTLALYFNCKSEGQRARESYTHVPYSATEDATVTIEPVAVGIYGLAPYPFDRDDLELSFEGRYLAPVGHGESLKTYLQDAPGETQTILLKSLG